MVNAAAIEISRRCLATMAAGVAAIVVAGCAGLQPGASDEQVVAERAKQRWDAVIAGDIRKAYGYISPAGRSVVSYEGYAGMFRRGFHKAARVTEVRCQGREVCDVTLEIEYMFSGRPVKTPLFEKWVKQDSDWWYLYQQ